MSDSEYLLDRGVSMELVENKRNFSSFVLWKRHIALCVTVQQLECAIPAATAAARLKKYRWQNLRNNLVFWAFQLFKKRIFLDVLIFWISGNSLQTKRDVLVSKCLDFCRTSTGLT